MAGENTRIEAVAIRIRRRASEMRLYFGALGDCGNVGSVGECVSVLDVGADVLLSVLPTHSIFQLRAAAKEREKFSPGIQLFPTGPNSEDELLLNTSLFHGVFSRIAISVLFPSAFSF
jgi:hypothetical protein